MSKLCSWSFAAIIILAICGLFWKTTMVEGIAYELFSQSNSLRENFEEFKECAEKARQGENKCPESSLKRLFLQRDSIIAAHWQNTFDILEAKPYWAWLRANDRNAFFSAIATRGRERLRNECNPVITYMYTEGRTIFNFDHRYRCSDDPRPPSGGLSF